jgi:hypothetical protein
MMKKTSILLSAIITTLVFSCTSTGSRTYRLTFDPAINDPFIQSAWLSYAAPIRSDMFQFYQKNPNGVYTTPYNVEMEARNSMMDFYLRMQKDYKIYDRYIEDIIKIRESSKLNEYVFFSFNPGNWVNDRNFDKEHYTQWMKENMPEHIPLTLARVQKIE